MKGLVLGRSWTAREVSQERGASGVVPKKEPKLKAGSQELQTWPKLGDKIGQAASQGLAVVKADGDSGGVSRWAWPKVGWAGPEAA